MRLQKDQTDNFYGHAFRFRTNSLGRKPLGWMGYFGSGKGVLLSEIGKNIDYKRQYTKFKRN